LLDRRVACLDRRRAKLAALVEVLSTKASAELIDRSIEAALSLPSLAPCADASSLLLAVPPPEDPSARRAVGALRAHLDEVSALASAGVYEHGRELARQSVVAARALGYDPVLAEALFELGVLEDGSGAPAAAAEAWYEAAGLALRTGDDRLAVRAYTELMWSVGYRQAKVEQAMVLHRVANALADKVGDPLIEARLAETLGDVQIVAGAFDDATANLERALDLQRAAGDGVSPMLGVTALDALGYAAELSARFEAAVAYAERALALREQMLGPGHPDVAFALTNLGEAHAALGDMEQAEGYARRALALREARLGPDHPSLAAPYGTLATVALSAGDARAAEGHLRRALVLIENAVGPDDPNLASFLGRLAKVCAARGDYDAALAAGRRALGLLESVAGARGGVVPLLVSLRQPCVRSAG
jgi:serine/threonine-protein kinase